MKKKKPVKKKECPHNAVASTMDLKRFQKTKEDTALSHYSGTLKAHCKDCGHEFVFTGMPRVNADATEITLFMVPRIIRQQTTTND
jgi:hypothetical protein